METICRFARVRFESHIKFGKLKLGKRMDKRLTDEELNAVREAFCLFDVDGDGRISTKDLGTLVRSLGINPSEAQVRQMIREVDFNGTGHVELKEFVGMFSRHKHEVSTVDEVVDAFRVFDKDGNGYVSASELRHVLLHLGERLKEEEVNDMIREADISGDGQINYADFAKILLAK